MFKLPLRLVGLVACCLLFSASTDAGPVRIGFGDNQDAFSLTITGSAINAPFTYGPPSGGALGMFWEIRFTVTEANLPGDRVTVKWTAQHVKAPHGEPIGLIFGEFELGPIGIASNSIGPSTITRSLGADPPHGSHFDRYLAVLTISGFDAQSTGYSFHLEGRHCSPNCPLLPTETDILPEPTTLLLLGTGLVGVAIKTRKRLKGGKTGQGSQ